MRAVTHPALVHRTSRFRPLLARLGPDRLLGADPKLKLLAAIVSIISGTTSPISSKIAQEQQRAHRIFSPRNGSSAVCNADVMPFSEAARLAVDWDMMCSNGSVPDEK
jgi:hypothetical protein